MSTRATVVCAVLAVLFGVGAWKVIDTLQTIGYDVAMDNGALWVGLLFVTIIPAIVLGLTAIIGFVFGEEEF